MQRLLIALIIVGGLAIACGSDSDGVDPAATGTPKGERAERVEPRADGSHREGLPISRNVVGDPDAPVLIVEYSDFQ